MWSLESRRDPVHQASLAVGVLVWRRSRAALVTGTSLFALFFVVGMSLSLVQHRPPAVLVVALLLQGPLLFVMVRGLVSLWRKQ